MEVHKPKAAHSWREFAIEIGTIICGILIALTLEQLVEALHWRSEVDETRSRRPYRVVCELYAKLLAMVVQHWALLAAGYQMLKHSAQRAARRTPPPGRHGISDLSSQPVKSPIAYPMAAVIPDMTACMYHTRGSSDGVSDRQ